MMKKHTLIAFVALATGASAQTNSNTQPTDTERKSCVIQIASKLPTIEGLTIVATRQAPFPPDYSQLSRETGAMFVEMDFKAGAIEGTYGVVQAQHPWRFGRR
jgi:hypothetical protein